jgi:hypothetical protein
MIFKVSEKFKGSCVLPTINKAIWANMTISITGNDLRAGDIKDVVRKGILIPVDEDYDRDAIEKDHDVIIINNTDRVLVLGQTALRPNGSLPISKDEAKIPEIIAAAADGIITIISDEDEEESQVKKKAKKKVTKKAKKKVTKKAKKKVAKKVELIEEITPDYVVPESGEDKEPTAVTWNPQTQELEEAIKIPKSEDFIKVGEDEREDVDFVDEEEEVEEVKKNKKSTKKKAKKKTTKKKATKKASVKKTKKKGNKTKSKNVKTLTPVGEKRLPKTDMDAAIELDSRGRPIGDKPGDTLRHLIDSINAPEDVAFVDDEQSLDRYKKRTDME